MKSEKLMWTAELAVCAVLMIPVPLAAQHHHYKVIDMGTLAGPTAS